MVIRLSSTNYNTEAGGNIYLMERSVTFCQAVITNLINNALAPTRRKFVDCENYRFGWAADTNCGANQTCG